ncbi:hypothetical protein HU200_019132 [Digitaria exilis]|uniref:Uncharacterized protein n=1 Tax=Digitaria exilis TaxID=1010633 RepID=A0A835F2K5_9POAL|nr:hypothetical protein HU200_019132 [Digitaria exilis]
MSATWRRKTISPA